jgi:hypothetical protein
MTMALPPDARPAVGSDRRARLDARAGDRSARANGRAVACVRLNRCCFGCTVGLGDQGEAGRICGVIPDAETLPADPDALRAPLLAERARHAGAIGRIEQERDAAIGESARLRAIIQALQRHRFGRRSERFDPDQLALGLEDTE